MDWRPEHEGDRPRASWKRTAFDVLIAVLVVSVIGAAALACIALVAIFPAGLPQ